jgi:hypothetical protein
MSNVVVNPTASMSTMQILASLKNAVAKGSAVKTYIKFDGKSGRLSTKDNTEDGATFAPKQKFLLNIREMKRKHVCWKNGTTVETVEQSIFDVNEPELPDHGPYSTDPEDREGWKTQFVVDLLSQVDNKAYVFTMASGGAINSANAFIRDFSEYAEAQHSLKGIDVVQSVTPVVELDVELFTVILKGKKLRNYKPVLRIVEWKENPKSDAELAAAAIPATKSKTAK